MVHKRHNSLDLDYPLDGLPRDWRRRIEEIVRTLGIDFDPEKAYDDRKEIYRMSGKIVRTTACVQTAEGDKDGLWTTAIAAAVFLL